MHSILFILAGTGGTKKLDRYSSQLLLAAMTVKYFHPNVNITCLGDIYCENLLNSKSELFGGMIDRFIACPDATGGPVHRSRVIKATLRHRVDGPFIYLDSDIALINGIHHLFQCESQFGLTLDSWYCKRVGEFPDWCTPVYRDLNWDIPPTRYYNSGVMYVDNSPACYSLFEKWHERYLQSVDYGINLDQPAFNSALANVGPLIREYSDDYNFFCGQSPRAIPTSARLLHMCCSLPITEVQAYETGIACLQMNENIDLKDFIDKLKHTNNQNYRKCRYFWDIRRRALEFIFRKLFRMKLVSAQKH